MIVKQKFKDFITCQIEELGRYDAMRPDGHVYEFHLHSERVATMMKAFAVKMGMGDDMAEALYWATLPHDIGKMKLSVNIWDSVDKPTEEQKLLRRTHTTTGIQIMRDEFGDECDNNTFLALTLDIMENHHECIDGTGFIGKTGDQLSREVLMACICDAFDGWSIARPHFSEQRDISPKGVIHRMESEKNGHFDTNLLKTFKEIVLCSSKPYLSPPLSY